MSYYLTQLRCDTSIIKRLTGCYYFLQVIDFYMLGSLAIH